MKQLSCLIFLLFFFSFPLAGSEEDVANRIYAYLNIRDPFGACQEAIQGLKEYPGSVKIWEAYIKALSKRGDEQGLLGAWDAYRKLEPKNPPKSEVLENVSWGIIKAGSENNSPLIRVVALLAAYYGNDTCGVEIIHHCMRDMHAGVRGAAAEVAGKMRDAKLCEGVLAQLKTERDVQVQLALIHAVGGMRIDEAKPYLLQLVSQPDTRAEHRAAAIASLLDMTKNIDRDQLVRCIKSDRAGLRLLACECISYLGSTRDFDLLLVLTDDTNNDVRAAALQAIGLLEINENQKERAIAAAEKHVKDLDPSTAISAAWLLTLKVPQSGQQSLKPWLEHESQDVRLTAAGALVAAGRYGRPLLDNAFLTSQDRFVKVNLAMGMIALRINSQAGCEAIKVAMEEDKGRWMKDDCGLFTFIAPSTEHHKSGVANYPEAVNQLLRLELINTMAMLRYPEAQEAVKGFLRERVWGVTGLAAASLLTEGDEYAVKMVEELLEDPQQKVRAQAALILSLWGGGEAALNVLQEAYANGHREMKEQILEAMGNIHSPLVVPFLVERLHEPSQTLRIIAASSLLRTLN